MKHRQVGVNNVGVINTDGHAIGLDIGATAVRAAVLAPGTLEGRPSVTIHGAGQVPLPFGAVVNGVVEDQGAVTAAIKQLWTMNRLECRHVILGVASQHVLVRDLTMPDLDEAQRAKALPYQAKDVVALPLDQVVLDFCQLGEPDPDTNMIRGLLLAAPRQPVVAAVQAVERANLKVARVDLSGFGSLRAIGDEHLAVEAVVDLGAHLTTLVVHDHGVPKLVRTLARGGQAITEQLAENLGVEPSEAERIKWDGGLEHDNDEVRRLLIDAVRPLIAEIRTSIGFFRSTNDGAVLERISLTGGGSRLGGLVAALNTHTGLPTRVTDPLQHIRNRHASKEIRGEAMHLASAVSLGLAMGAAA